MIPITPPVKVVLPKELDKESELAKQWEALPFYASEETDMQKSLSLVKDANTENSKKNEPSQLAGLSPHQIQDCYTVQLIDDVYRRAIASYKSSLNKETNADRSLALLPRNTSNDFSLAVATGAARFTAKAPKIPVIKQIVTPILALVGGIFGIVMKKKITQERINSERSANRNKWCTDVILKEDIRKNDAIQSIKRRVEILQYDIESMNGDLIDVSLFEELIILEKMIKAFDPKGSLFEQHQSVQEYMKFRGIDESIIADLE